MNGFDLGIAFVPSTVVLFSESSAISLSVGLFSERIVFPERVVGCNVAIRALGSAPLPSVMLLSSIDGGTACANGKSVTSRLSLDGRLERIPLTFEHSLHGERSSCILLR